MFSQPYVCRVDDLHIIPSYCFSVTSKRRSDFISFFLKNSNSNIYTYICISHINHNEIKYKYSALIILIASLL